MAEEKGTARKYANGTSTAATLMEFALKELDRSGPLDFSLDTVLAESGVSRGSFYHHFGDRASIIARCEAEKLKLSLKSDNEILRAFVESDSTGEQIFEILALRIRMNGSAEQVQRRQQRIATIAMAFGDDALREMLNDAQAKGTEYFFETLLESQKRGQIDPVSDLEGVAQLVQTMFLGRVLIDQFGDSRLSDLINEATIDALRLMVRPQP